MKFNQGKERPNGRGVHQKFPTIFLTCLSTLKCSDMRHGLYIHCSSHICSVLRCKVINLQRSKARWGSLVSWAWLLSSSSSASGLSFTSKFSLVSFTTNFLPTFKMLLPFWRSFSEIATGVKSLKLILFFPWKEKVQQPAGSSMAAAATEGGSMRGSGRRRGRRWGGSWSGTKPTRGATSRGTTGWILSVMLMAWCLDGAGYNG